MVLWKEGSGYSGDFFGLVKFADISQPIWWYQPIGWNEPIRKRQDDWLPNNPFCSADIKEFVCGLTATLIYLVFAVFFFNMLLICDSLNSVCNIYNSLRLLTWLIHKNKYSNWFNILTFKQLDSGLMDQWNIELMASFSPILQKSITPIIHYL